MAKRFELRIVKDGRPVSATYFTIFADGTAVIDDMCGTSMRESVEMARSRWNDMVKRGWVPAA